MERKEVKGLSLEEARRELEGYAKPKSANVPPDADVTTQLVIDRRRRLGRYYTKEIALSVGIVGVVTYFAWFFLRAQAESSPRPVRPPEPVVVVAPPHPINTAPPVRTAQPSPARPEPPKPAKPIARPKPAPVEEPAPAEPDPLLHRTFEH